MFLKLCLGKGKNLTVIVTAIAVPVSVCVLLLGAVSPRRRIAVHSFAAFSLPSIDPFFEEEERLQAQVCIMT
jgi:hypothetical protein